MTISHAAQRMDSDGYLIAPGILESEDVSAIDVGLGALSRPKPGTRSLLDLAWGRRIAGRLRSHPDLRPVLDPAAVAVQCTLFDKSPESNWLVALHQDLGIPVAERVRHEALQGWSVKEGQVFVQPPDALLDQLVAVRVHVDDCASENGPLRVVPGSHRHGRLDAEEARRFRDRVGEVTCTVAKGDALVFKPLLLHASSKAASPSRRRVLHFLFGPPDPGYGLRWRHAA